VADPHSSAASPALCRGIPWLVWLLHCSPVNAVASDLVGHDA